MRTPGVLRLSPLWKIYLLTAAEPLRNHCGLSDGPGTGRHGASPRPRYSRPALTARPAPRHVVPRAAAPGVALFSPSRQAFDKAANREGPAGWLAGLPDIETDLSRIEVDARSLFRACESVEKPGN